MLRVEEVRFRYGEASPLLRYDMRVEAASIVAVVGASGSGKSTLLDIVAGFLSPLSGDIVLDGTSLLSRPPHQRNTAIVFQRDNLFEHLSVARNIALAKNGATREEVRAMLKAVGLAGYETKPASSLSGGEAQRVALARAMLQEASVLLLDEPFSALDSQSKARAQALLVRLTRENGWHTVVVTHDRGDIEALGAHVYTMEDGVLRRGV